MGHSSRARLAFAAVPLAAFSRPVAASADAPPPPPFHPVPGVLAVPAPVAAFVPRDGDTSVARTAVQAVLSPPGGSPVRKMPVEKTSSPHAKDPGVAPFLCVGDAECYFTRLPAYNQGNPNFAYVDVPTSVYSAEHKPVPGSLGFDQATYKWIFTMSNGTVDPFFSSWLPYGPLPGDQGHIPKWWFTAICGPTSSAMSLMGALAARASTTQIVPGSWLDTSFVHARRPAGQAALPSPLVVDHNTVAADQAQMTGDEIQRVINTAEILGTDPTAGGTEDLFAKVQHDFRFSDTAHPHQVVWLDDNSQALRPAHLVDLMRQRYSVVIGIHPHKAHLTPNMLGRNVISYGLTFTANGGHCLALSGFSGGATSSPTFTIYDPVYAAVIQKQFVEIVATAGQTHDGKPLYVQLPSGASTRQIMQYDDAPAIASVGDIKDGDNVIFVDEYHAMKLE
jgi:hypothetical protein